MYELSNWIDIHNAYYFTTIFQEEEYTKEDFDNLIEYMYYLSQDQETKLIYPRTVYFIPEIIKSVKRVRDNSIIINDAIEKIEKGGENLRKVRFLKNYGEFIKDTYRAIIGESDTHYVILNSASGMIDDISELPKPLRGMVYDVVERS
jgi:hypothetical protein